MYQVNGSRFTAGDLLEAKASGRFRPEGNCTSPVEVRYRGTPDPVRVLLALERDTVGVAYFNARCRKCDNCLEHRRRLWTARAIAECAVSVRSWFGTLTFGPDARVKYLYQAQLRNTRSCGLSWHELEEAERFRKLVEEMTPETTKFLKRVRKNSGAALRYLLVSEAHEDGFPHFHLLVHEVRGTVTKRVADAAWKQGFSKFKLVEMGNTLQAAYVCKYLSKSALTRVRASQRYGQIGQWTDLVAERLEAVNGLVRNVQERRGPVPRDEGARSAARKTTG